MVPSRVYELALHTIFRRCVQCPSESPSCPSCANDQICSLVPQACDACSYAVCIANPNPTPPSRGPNIGAIAGGVIGGVVLMAVVMVLLWRFWIKKRREEQELEAEEWAEDDIARQKSGAFNPMRSADASSVRTRASFANSILSRASNIIQIAYIPGVTNRNGSSHNSLAPVPPVPAAYANSPKSPLSNNSDALFFRPESTWSDSTSLRSANRDTQYTRQSITPSLARSSIASDIFHDNASTHPMPAMPAMPVARGIPRVVSVKGSTTTSSNPSTPGGSPSLAKSVTPGQTPSPSGTLPNSRAAGSFGKAKKVTVGGKGRFPVRNNEDSSSPGLRTTPTTSSPLVPTVVEDDEDEDEDEHKSARRSLLASTSQNSSSASVSTTPSAQTAESPFFDASEALETPPATTPTTIPRANPYAAMSSSVGANDKRQTRGAKSVGGLSAVIEEASRHGSDSTQEKPDMEGPKSPFGDEHAAS